MISDLMKKSFSYPLSPLPVC